MDLETQNQVLNALVAQTRLLQKQAPSWYTHGHNRRAVEAIEKALGRELVNGCIAETRITENEIKELNTSYYTVHYVTPRGSNAIQHITDLLLQHNPLTVVTNAKEIEVIWKQEDDEKRFQAAWKASLEPVKLYEDNMGNLYLHQVGSSLVYQVALPSYQAPDYSFFEDDCRDIAQGNATDWKEELVHGYAEMQHVFNQPETHLIAVWYPDKPYALQQQPGEAGKRYLQLPS